MTLPFKASRPGDVTCGSGLAPPLRAEERPDQSVERVWHATGCLCGFPESPLGPQRQAKASWPSSVSPDDCGWSLQGGPPWSDVTSPGRLALKREVRFGSIQDLDFFVPELEGCLSLRQILNYSNLFPLNIDARNRFLTKN